MNNLGDKKLNFEAKTEGDLVTLFNELRKISDDYLQFYIRRWRRWSDLYHLYLDLKGKDPYAIHPKLGKTFAWLESTSSKAIRTLFGALPYFPLKAKNEWNRANVRAIESLLNHYSTDTENPHFVPLTQWIKTGIFYGISYIKPYWALHPKARKVRRVKREYGVDVGFEAATFAFTQEGLRYRHLPPWMVGFDPRGSTPSAMRWFYYKQIISRTELRKMMDNGIFDVSWQEFNADREYTSRSARKALDMELEPFRMRRYDSGQDDDICWLICLWLPFQHRYVVLVDGDKVIKNSQTAEDFYIPVTPIRFSEDVDGDAFIGVSNMIAGEQLANLMDLNLFQKLNYMDKILNETWLYNSDVFQDSDDLRVGAGGGSRIAVTTEELAKVNYDYELLVHQLQAHPLPPDAWRLGDELEQHFEQAVRQPQLKQGIPATGGKRTAFEYKELVDAYDEDFAVQMKLAEAVGLEVLARNSYYTIARNIEQKDVQAILGPQAGDLAYLDITEIPGGVTFRMKGSSLMIGEQGKQNERLALLQTAGPFLNQREMAAIAVENSDAYDEEQKRRIVSMPQPAPGPAGPASPEELIMANKLPQAPTPETVQKGVMAA